MIGHEARGVAPWNQFGYCLPGPPAAAAGAAKSPVKCENLKTHCRPGASAHDRALQ
ncbi:Hypothetical protein D9617_2g057610 [Elsinoe fawcettii]|nr:Hypothetical protein D9617_2g057610 [Elsinoe fawcettii]